MLRVWFILPLLFFASCAPVEKVQNGPSDPAKSLIWPPPPQTPKIKYLYAFRGPEDLGIRPSFFGRLLEFIAGEEDRQMVRPYAIAAADGLIAVADPGLGVLHFFDMDKHEYVVVEKVADERLVSPVGVAFGPGRIYLSDSILGKVFILDRKGEYLGAITGLERPTGIAYHPGSNRLFVADTLAHEVVSFDANGSRVRAFGSRGNAQGEFNFPSHVTLHGDTLYVNDTMNFQVQAFDVDGDFLFSFGQVGDGSGSFSQPKGVGTDSAGNIYVVDAIFDKVQIFDVKGRFLLAFGERGHKAGEFWLPTGIFVIKDKIFVADSYNERVQVFEFVGAKL
ncbi:MAG: 6-bladed beta-propeller [Rhodospirillales bacterium]|nr:6-bladed beta-propeller [Rhodospirillales bacterium]